MVIRISTYPLSTVSKTRLLGFYDWKLSKYVKSMSTQFKMHLIVVCLKVQLSAA